MLLFKTLKLRNKNTSPAGTMIAVRDAQEAGAWHMAGGYIWTTVGDYSPLQLHLKA